MNTKLSPLFKAIGLFSAGLVFSGVASAATVDFRIIETTDIHANILDYDFYRDATSTRFGLVRAASLVKQARAENPNNVLVDNGDLIQGSPMGDWKAAEGLKKGEVHPAHKVMNAMNYDVGNVGNHEFNYGLEFFKNTVAGANFPYISANVIDAKTGDYLVDPYIIKDVQVKDTDGKPHTLKVGFIGFVPPQIMNWDRTHLTGKVEALDITESARKLVPEMREKGADIVIAIPHSGLSTDPYRVMAENSVYYLSRVEGIDAIMFGHSHAQFPSPGFAHIPGVNLEQGTINGIASVMPGFWGSHIGIVDMTLDNSEGSWQIVQSRGKIRAIAERDGTPIVEADKELAKLVDSDLKATQDFVNRPLGKASDAMYSFLSLVQDDPTVQIVNNAQLDYVQHYIKGDPDLDGLPVLSASAPFKAGGRKNDPTNYVEVEPGILAFRNAADLYLYPNTLSVMKITGAQLRDWLERSAGMFNQIDPKSEKQQALLNWDTFRTYNFDVIDGVSYEIDVTQPSRFNEKGEVTGAKNYRIKKLTRNGKPVKNDDVFLVASNNYRAHGGGSFPGTGADNLAFDAPDENRQILANYIAKVSKEEGEVKTMADNNWRLARIKTKKKLNVVFETAPSEKASKFIATNARHPMTKIGIEENGFALYSIDLTK